MKNSNDTAVNFYNRLIGKNTVFDMLAEKSVNLLQGDEK